MKKIGFLSLSLFLTPFLVSAMHPMRLCPSFSKSLAFGARSEEVKALQNYLAGEPEIYPEALVTGYFGRLTEAAVKRFQAREGIVSSGAPLTTGYGVFGPRTRARLKEVCEKLNFEHEEMPILPAPLPIPSPQQVPSPTLPMETPATPPAPIAAPEPAPAPSPAPQPVIGSYNGTICSLEVEPKIALLGRDRPEATWKIYSSPTNWHFYWHSIVDGIDEGDAYGGVTNKSSLVEYPYKPGKYSRYAHIVIEQNHIISVSSADKTKHSDAVCTTNTVDFEIK